MASLCLALLALGCEQGSGIAPIDVRIVGPDGANPVEGRDGTLHVEVRHLGELLTCDGGDCESEIVDGRFELVLPVDTFDGENEIQVRIESGDDRLVGAAPPFRIFLEGVDVSRSVRVVVAPAPSCATLTLEGFTFGEEPRLSPARAGAAAVVRRNVALLAGGEDAGGASDDVDSFDQLLFDAGPLRTWEPRAIGRARGHALSEDRSLVVGDASSWVFERNDLGQAGARELSLHAGAGSASAIADLGSAGAAVVGGAASIEVAWIGVDGRAAAPSALSVRRDAPAAAAIGSGVLVVGGHAEGEAAAEWLPRFGDGVALDVAGLPAGRGGVLFPSPDGADALWIGFEVDGAPSGEAFVLRGCDRDACEGIEAVEWPRPRSGFATVVTAAGALWLIGGERDEGGVLVPSREVDLVRWAGRAPVIEAGPDLRSPRAGAAAFEHASGVVVVAGGLGEAALAADLEMCFPPALDPL